MNRRAFICLLAAPLFAAVPTPKDHFGYTPGDDFRLADHGEILGYFDKLAKASDRIRVVPFGKSANGRPMVVAFLSDAANLKQLDRFREINQRLALGKASPEEAKKLAGEGKAIVWIDSGLHATETAPAQHSPELAYRMVSAEDAETARIRRNVILMQIPVINPDGLDMVVHWYRKNAGTPYELAPLPGLYQKYAGHDNNRDWFMLNLEETKHVTKLLFQEWFPHIVYNQHQSPAFPARIFVPPYAEPLNPNIPAPVMEGINLIGSAMKERFARENKPGILSYFGFDAWWNGGLRSVPAFHNMHGILTETAIGRGYGTPGKYDVSRFPERFGNGIPTKEPSVFYQRPWMGGRWGTREAIEYMLTADFAILDLAATRPEHFLYKAWEMAQANSKAMKPFAYVVPAEQWDRSSSTEMVRRLQMAGVEVQRARAPFKANGKEYGEGSYVLMAGQAFRPYLVDLMEAQKYPELRAGTTGPTKRPYDVAGWTLPMQMGVRVERVEDAFQANLETVKSVSPAGAGTTDLRENAAYLTLRALLEKGTRVRWSGEAKILTEADAGFDKAAWEIRAPRVALYEPHTSNMDAGWTQWLLDHYRVPHTLLKNEEIRKGALRAKYDVVLLAAQSAQSILHGTREGERVAGRGSAEAEAVTILQRPEYTGGITAAGASALEEFVREGGTLVTFDTASELPVQYFGLPVRASLPWRAAEGGGREEESSAGGYYCPGSLLRVTVDPSHPLATGMPKDAIVMSTGGQAYEITLLPDFNKGDRETKSVARYASKDLLASGWISGERAVLGRSLLVEARHGKGKVVLFGFRPQFRGQSFGTFKFVLNAVYLSAAQRL
ncbi:MAG: M14 family metallopeptidase [Bryobacteraceae bacterium]|nr:M14 family metallopeptidase [Bryobacteraceae bacterium]